MREGRGGEEFGSRGVWSVCASASTGYKNGLCAVMESWKMVDHVRGHQGVWEVNYHWRTVSLAH